MMISTPQVLTIRRPDGSIIEVEGELISKRYSLSARNREVLELVAEGRSNKEIGIVLNMAERTVKAHIARMSRIYGVAGGSIRVKLAAIYFKDVLNAKDRRGCETSVSS